MNRWFPVLLAAGIGLTAVVAALVLSTSDSNGDDEFWHEMGLWRSLDVVAAAEAEEYLTLEDMTHNASVVVRGEVVSRYQAAILQGDVPDDVLYVEALEVEVAEVLGGKHSAGVASGDTLTVEFLIGTDLTRRPVPEAEYVLFLRAKADHPRPLPRELDAYRLVSTEGLWVEGPDGKAVNPFLEWRWNVAGESTHPLSMEEGSSSLAQFVSEARSAGKRGPHDEPLRRHAELRAEFPEDLDRTAAMDGRPPTILLSRYSPEDPAPAPPAILDLAGEEVAVPVQRVGIHPAVPTGCGFQHLPIDVNGQKWIAVDLSEKEIELGGPVEWLAAGRSAIALTIEIPIPDVAVVSAEGRTVTYEAAGEARDVCRER